MKQIFRHDCPVLRDRRAHVPSNELRELRQELVVAHCGDPLGHGVDGGEGDVQLGPEVPDGGPRLLDGVRLGAIGVLAPQQRALLLVRQPDSLPCLRLASRNSQLMD
jgi:hypothetical protein